VTTLQPEVLQIRFNADPALHAVDPPNVHDPGVINVTTRYVMPIVFELVATLLSNEWSPWEFFMMVYPQLVATGLQVACEALISWICVACTTCGNQRSTP
jgi:hypothetical protein